jgi:general stress protein 26
MTNEREKKEGIQKLSKLIKGIKFAMLTTSDDNGVLRSRPMATQESEFDGTLWFFTRQDTPKVDEIKKDHHVNVSYADPDKNRYVSVSGMAQLVKNKDIIRDLWNPLYHAWFPDGLDDPQLALLKINVDHAEYWDSPSSRMVQVAGFIKAIATGKPAHPDTNKKLDLTG